jgi:hypothetical protein
MKIWTFERLLPAAVGGVLGVLCGPALAQEATEGAQGAAPESAVPAAPAVRRPTW